LPLQEHRYGVRVAPIQDRSLLDQAQFYLAVKCEWGADRLRNRLPSTIKAGGVEQLSELVNLQLPGIDLVPQPVAPRQVPYSSGYTYFQLEKSPQHWAHLKKSGGIAFHISGEIPGLELELWAVKR
jgi:type VI secretion system protein ImpJ